MPLPERCGLSLNDPAFSSVPSGRTPGHCRYHGHAAALSFPAAFPVVLIFSSRAVFLTRRCINQLRLAEVNSPSLGSDSTRPHPGFRPGGKSGRSFCRPARPRVRKSRSSRLPSARRRRNLPHTRLEPDPEAVGLNRGDQGRELFATCDCINRASPVVALAFGRFDHLLRLLQWPRLPLAPLR